MKQLVTHITVALLALLWLTSCSHNNGDIGYWYGLWHLDSIEVDGMSDETYDGHYFFMFQGKVFSLAWIDEDNHERLESYASWQPSNDDATMTISFVDSRFTPHLGNNVSNIYLSTVTHFNVITLDATHMVLSTTSAATGSAITYHLTIVK